MEMIEYGHVNRCSDGPLQRVFKMIILEKDRSEAVVKQSRSQYYIHVVVFMAVCGLTGWKLYKQI